MQGGKSDGITAKNTADSDPIEDISGTADNDGTTAKTVKLERANLRNTELDNVDLRHSNLQQSDLNGANLNHTKYKGVNWTGATMPDGSLWVEGSTASEYLLED